MLSLQPHDTTHNQQCMDLTTQANPNDSHYITQFPQPGV